MGDGLTKSDSTPLLKIAVPGHFLLLASLAFVVKTDLETLSSFTVILLHIHMGYNFPTPVTSSFCLPWISEHFSSIIDFLFCFIML